ncbi:MAG: hypothetical protein H0T62_10970 [Parachlamydiaceae bacterium]|nr:hypothetical protein [Parachlamydiaceae bacterium]
MNIEVNNPGPYLDPAPCNFDPQILPELIFQQQLAQENKEKSSSHSGRAKRLGHGLRAL